MPKGPKGEKRPADVIGAAVKIAKIATGEIEEDPPPERKAKTLPPSPSANEAEKHALKPFIPERRAEIAKKCRREEMGKIRKHVRLIF